MSGSRAVPEVNSASRHHMMCYTCLLLFFPPCPPPRLPSLNLFTLTCLHMLGDSPYATLWYWQVSSLHPIDSYRLGYMYKKTLHKIRHISTMKINRLGIVR